ncbi:putative RDD family membrane protein YckC [Silvimonas terrae]|uniref:Putative RDD family membrane protein YckC n=1 Tax=Silvimonas terrae TaxID=300266 RepID=A0A840RL21_9NEIS|nr:RDD family protein [Silvimonas terrae]MBB5192912.1 putative RDD family membrane protein YckC [Silvimonas terrae]
MLDPYYRVTTPEGVELTFTPAGPVRRAQAWLADAAICGVLQIVLGIFCTSLPGGAGTGVFLIGFFLINSFYKVLYEVRGKGMTPGKRWMGLKVIQDDGTPLLWRAGMIRNIVRFADLLPACYGVGLISMLADGRFRRLGDIAAGTIVVYRPELTRASPALDDVTPLAPPTALSHSEQRLLLNLAERAPQLPPARLIELSDLARPLTGRTGESGWERLRAMIAWLAGNRGAEP